MNEEDHAKLKRKFLLTFLLLMHHFIKIKFLMNQVKQYVE